METIKLNSTLENESYKMSEENKTEFRVGDIVEFAGTEGEIFKINSDIPDRYLSVSFGLSHMQEICFQKDGKLWDWQNIPSLKLVRKAKKKMNIEVWVNVYSGGTRLYFDTKIKADEHEHCFLDSERIACVKLVSEEEVEV